MGVAKSRGEAVFYGDGWWVIFPIIGMAFMALIIGLVFMWLMRMDRRGGERKQDSERDDSALEVLRRRYAAGEISDEEFDAKRRRLEGR